MKYILLGLFSSISFIQCTVPPTIVVFDINGVVLHVGKAPSFYAIVRKLGIVYGLQFIATAATKTDWTHKFFEVLEKVSCNDVTLHPYGDNLPMGRELPLPPIMIAWQEGKLSSSEILARTHAYIASEKNFSDFEKATLLCIAEIAFDPETRTALTYQDSEVVTLIKELHDNNIPVYALTNQDPQHLEALKIKFPELFALFLTVIASSDSNIQACKPGTTPYTILSTTHNIRPEEIVFIDDQPENTQKARELGWHGIQHTNARSTREALRKLGLPVRPE